jgi:hypothetical protein
MDIRRLTPEILTNSEFMELDSKIKKLEKEILGNSKSWTFSELTEKSARIFRLRKKKAKLIKTFL